MSKAFEEIVHEAKQLSREQRLNLASVLLELEDRPEDDGVQAAWEMEIQERIRAIENGTASSVSYDEVMRKADDLLSS